MTTKDILIFLHNHTLSTEECSDIFRTLKEQDAVIGGKLWTLADIDSMIDDDIKKQMTDTELKEFIDRTTTYLNEDTLNDCTDEEWNAITWAIHDTMAENF